jgi:hypothetical protein
MLGVHIYIIVFSFIYMSGKMSRSFINWGKDVLKFSEVETLR